MPLRAPAGGDPGAVASVGGTNYPSLQEAIDAAVDGDTVTLLADRTESVTVGKSITLDLGGHTLSTSTDGEDQATIVLRDNKILTIKNGTIVGGEAKYGSSASAIDAEGGVNLEDVTISGCTGPGYAITMEAYSDLGKDLRFTNVTVSGTQSHVIWGGAKNNIAFTNCHFDGNTPEGTNRLLAFGGVGSKTFSECTFKGNKAQGIADVEGTYTDCVFTGNEVAEGAVVSARNWEDDRVALIKTVVKDNTCTHEYGVAGVDTYNLTLDNSAVYNNTNTAGGRTDLGEDCSDVDVTTMKDPTDPSMDFSGYGVDSKGTVKPTAPVFEAEIDGVKYKKLAEAVDAAKDGDTIKIINTDEVGDVKAIEVPKEFRIKITKALTIDLNRRDATSEDGWSFYLAGAGGKLSIINSADDKVSLKGWICNSDTDCSLTVGDKINLEDYLLHNGNTIIEGSHDRLYLSSYEELNDGKTMPVNFGESFEYTGGEATLMFDLAESEDDLNDLGKEMDDIVIAHGATADLANKVALYGVTNPFVKVEFKPASESGGTGDLVVHKDPGTFVYLNGVGGDDSKDGTTKANAVKTFEKAKELAEALSAQGKNVIISVIDTVEVSSEATWEFKDPEKVAVFRDAEFNDNLVKVSGGGNLTLKNIVIDGNKNGADAGKSSLVKVSGGTLTLGEGSVLQNNKLTQNDYPYSGGAVRVEEKGTVNVRGGTIRGNTAVWGGGIYALDGTVNVESGSITDNHAVKLDSEDPSGGGIATWYQSSVNISGGTISNNTSEGNGGGLSLGVSRVSGDEYSVLTMTGGTFEGNVANDSGGGLFVQGGTGEGYSRAYVSAGHFTNNTAESDSFGGGGIYVNGGHDWEGYHSGELYLTNALVTGNDAGENGGGYAACPTSNTEIRVKNGAAFYGNSAPSGNGLHVNASMVWHGASAQPDYEISESMLGGTPYHWTYDDGTEVPLSSLSGKLYSGELNLKNGITDADAALAKELATVFITGNHAGERGGGIGSNGDVYIGTSELIDVTVDKTWNDNGDAAGKRPAEIRIGLYRSVEGGSDEPVYIGYNKVKPDADGNWSVTFKKLPKSNQNGKLFVYTAKEIFDDDDPLPYGSASAGEVSGENGTIELTNTYETVNLSGEKTWEDANDQDGLRPESITVRLLADGEEVQSKTVTAADGWKWTFEGLPKFKVGKEIVYTIAEDEVAGYVTSIDGFNVTNTLKPTTDEPTPPPSNSTPPEKTVGTPQTGDTLLLISLVGILVASAVAIGALLALKRRKS